MSTAAGTRRVVVFGGTGRTGRHIVDALVAAGHVVTVAARNPSSPAADFPAAVRVVRADVQDEQSVVHAMADQDAVILAVSTPARHPGSLYSDAARTLTAAASITGVSRIVAISSGGVRRDDPALPLWYRKVLIPLFMSELYDDMGEMESIITASDLDWTIVRASYLRDHAGHDRYRVEDGATPRRGWKLARTDLARFTAHQLSTSQWVRKTPTLAE
jgi:uncharacterized protein YbjT (DUF2867 family)